MFSGTVAPGVDVGNLVCATGPASARTRPPKVRFRRADRIVMAASMLWIAALADAVV